MVNWSIGRLVHLLEDIETLNMRKKTSILLGFLILVNLPLIAQDRIEELDKLIKYCQENGMFNGNILVAEKGEILYHRSLGMENFESNQPLSIIINSKRTFRINTNSMMNGRSIGWVMHY